MRFSFAPYVLKPLKSLNSLSGVSPRSGALLRFEFDDGRLGFADCHPWPELGDLALKPQLDLLKQGRLTDLTRQSLFFAELDSRARASGKLLWEGRKIPDSHFLVSSPDELTEELVNGLSARGITRIKVKVGRDPNREVGVLDDLARICLQAGCRLRLDFNGKLSELQFQQFLNKMDLRILDFVEDPTEFNPEFWRMIRKEYPVRLALDRVPAGLMKTPGLSLAQNVASYDVLILKPAIQDCFRIFGDPDLSAKERVVTSYMDHPYGQLCAAWIASSFGVTSACGLMTHLMYEKLTGPGEDELAPIFSENLNAPTLGTGFGLDRFLVCQDWQDY